MYALLLKSLGIWLLLVVTAVANGIFRDRVLAPRYGVEVSLPLSGLSLSTFIYLVVYCTLPMLGRHDTPTYLCIGGLWLGLTVLFETLLGRLVSKASWQTLLAAYTFKNGNLWPLVLAVTFASPWLAAMLHGYIE